MVNKLANTKQTDDKKKRQVFNHTKMFVNMSVSMLTLRQPIYRMTRIGNHTNRNPRHEPITGVVFSLLVLD